MNLQEKLNWRYATKRMNGEKLPPDKLEKILEGIRLSASSMGFQPYTIYVIESEEMKKKISEKACKQPQVMESSQLLVFAAWTKAGESEIEDFFQLISKTRNAPMESLDGFRKSVTSVVTGKSSEELLQWTSKQAYIALGFGLVSAAVEDVDATPMEGFDPDAMDEVLGLKEKNQRSTVLLALGYRNPELDGLASAKKVRRSKDKLFTKL
ncbi:MAG: NAD(P)H-dependent oxidoreductase [Leptospira sp.]|nr:NAD(P)H-dependent oxidoreductase [Leptospira sp.]